MHFLNGILLKVIGNRIPLKEIYGVRGCLVGQRFYGGFPMEEFLIIAQEINISLIKAACWLLRNQWRERNTCFIIKCWLKTLLKLRKSVRLHVLRCYVIYLSAKCHTCLWDKIPLRKHVLVTLDSRIFSFI